MGCPMAEMELYAVRRKGRLQRRAAQVGRVSEIHPRRHGLDLKKNFAAYSEAQSFANGMMALLRPIEANIEAKNTAAVGARLQVRC